MVAAAIFENDGTLPLLLYLDITCFSWYVYQIPSKLDDK
jgi:hypothetical protein